MNAPDPEQPVRPPSEARPGAPGGSMPLRPPGSGPASPAPRPARAAPLSAMTATGAVAKDSSAYPGSITGLDLVRKNKRQSAVLIVLMILLGVVVGGVMGGAIGPYFSGLRETGRGFGNLYDVPSGSADDQLDRLIRNQEGATERFQRAP